MSFDNVCKYLAEQYPEEFICWLLSVQPRDAQVLKTELSVEPIRADAVSFLRTANQILHIEFQTEPYSNPPIPLRMLDYSVRLKRQYRCEVEQVVIFLQQTTSEIVFTQEYRDSTTLHRYRVVRLWEQDSAPFLDNPALLPFASLTRTNSPEALLGQVAQRLVRIEDTEQQRNLAGCTQVLAGLRFEKDLIHQLLREDIMRESVIYQDILQQGRRQEAFSFTMRLLNRRFGEVDASLTEQIQTLSTEQLEALGEALLDFSQVNELVTWLEQEEKS